MFYRFKAETTWKKPFGKYHLSDDVWPDNYRYPTYCGGPCTIVTSSTAEKIYNVANEIELSDFNVRFFKFIDNYFFLDGRRAVYRSVQNIC